MNDKYFIYILRCSDNALYTGITTDIKRRFSEHNKKIGAKYTRSHSVLRIEAVWETCGGRSVATKLECRIKKLSKASKEDLIKNPDKVKELIEISDIAVAEL